MIIFTLFYTFFKIGLFTIGGGYAMLPAIIDEVISHGWADEGALIDFIAVAESTPGPFAVNIATYIGRITGGLPGAFFATLGVVLPSFIIILLISKFYLYYKNSRIVSGCMSGLRPAVLGLIAAAAAEVGKTVFFPSGFSFSAVISLPFAVFAAIFAVAFSLSSKKISPVFVILISAAMGISAGYAGILG